MKKIIFAFFPLLIFISCHNSQSLEDDSTKYVRYSADAVMEKVEWTEEIDGEILTEKIGSSSGFDKKIKANGLNIFLSGKDSEMAPIYPSLSGFASLDLSKYTPGCLEKLNDFCKALVKSKEDYSSCAAYFAKDKVYSLVIFVYELESLFGPLDFCDYLIGEPFLEDESYECPVRLFYGQFKNYYTDYVDLRVYIRKTSGEWNLVSVEINLPEDGEQ